MYNNSWPLVGLFKKWLWFFSSLILILKHHVCFSVLILSGLCLGFFFFCVSAGFIKVQLVKTHRPYTEKDHRLGCMLCCPRIHNTFILELLFCRGRSLERPSRQVVRGQTDGMGLHLCLSVSSPFSKGVYDAAMSIGFWGPRAWSVGRRLKAVRATPQSKWATGSPERPEFAYMQREGNGVLRNMDDRGPIRFFLTHFISLCLLLLTWKIVERKGNMDSP